MQFLTRAKPRHDVAGLRQTLATAEALLTGLGYGEGVAGLIETDDPEALPAALRAAPRAPASAHPASFIPAGSKRDLMKLALRELHRAAPAPVPVIALPVGSPFGKVRVNVEGCTLCLSCVSVCPTQALGDAQDRPLLKFDESLCVQCGLCQATCPENVITLEPRLDFAAFDAEPVVIKQEEPFCCIGCGKPFGTRSTVERIVARLENKHWMFSGENRKRIDVVKMCENCRVEAVVNAGFDPFAGPARPAAKTSEDYIREREAKSREAAMLEKIERGDA